MTSQVEELPRSSYNLFAGICDVRMNDPRLLMSSLYQSERRRQRPIANVPRTLPKMGVACVWAIAEAWRQ